MLLGFIPPAGVCGAELPGGVFVCNYSGGWDRVAQTPGSSSGRGLVAGPLGRGAKDLPGPRLFPSSLVSDTRHRALVGTCPVPCAPSHSELVCCAHAQELVFAVVTLGPLDVSRAH